MRRFPPTLVATHTYVNPLVAVVLGWAIGGGETLTVRLLFGGLLVVAAIALMGGANSGEPTVARSASCYNREIESA